MATTYNTAAYCSGDLGPGNIQNYIGDIQGSGLTTVILWAVHIGRPGIPGQKYGDLIFNDQVNTFVSAGAFNPSGNKNIAAWPAMVAKLKQNSSVSKIFFSIGGASPPVYDFTTIEYMLKNGMADVLSANFAVMRNAFTVNGTCVIDGIDLDCEEGVEEATIVKLSQMLFKLGFEVTFCPYSNQSFWQDCMQALWKSGMKVSWWNLQCYAGGYDNRSNLSSWIDALAAVVGKPAAPSYLIPGLAVQGSEGDGQCPTGSNSIESTFAGWKARHALPGGFLWLYDSIVSNKQPCPGGVPNLASYVAAINGGLNSG